MQKTAPFEPTRARDTISTVSSQHSRRQGPGQPRTPNRCVQMRAGAPSGALQIGPTAHHGHPEQRPAKDGTSGRERARMGRERGTTSDVTHTQRGTSARPRKRPIGRDEVAAAARERPDHGPDRLRRSGSHLRGLVGKGWNFWRVAAVRDGQRMGREAGWEAQTSASDVALAAREDPPSPAARPGPIHRMGRVVHCQAPPLTGKASTRAKAQHRGR